MKNIMIAVFSCSILLLSCNKEKITGSGSVATEQRNVSNFFSVKVSGSSKVYITQGLSFNVTAKAYENILPVLQTRVENGVLIIDFKNNSNITNDNSEINITMPGLSSLEVSGDGSISTLGTFTDINNLSVYLSGSGSISINKATPINYAVNISGSGNLNSFGVVAENAGVKINGSGNASLSITGSLNASISGSGNIYYKGNNVQVTSQVSGSGRVIKQ